MKITRKNYFLLPLLLLCCLAAGCGRKEASTSYYEILPERQDFYDVSADMQNVRSNFLGMQFYQEEAVQLWAVSDPNDREKSDIYLYQTDGEWECIMKGLTVDFLSSSCEGFLDRDGNLYCFRRLQRSLEIYKTNPSGKQLYRHEEEGIALRDVCQLEDGRIFLTYSDAGFSGVVTYMPAELDRETGSITDASAFWYSANLSMGTGGSDLLCLNSEDIYRIDVDNGTRECIWTFRGTTYMLPSLASTGGGVQLCDFRINEEGCPELLFAGRNGKGGFLETLRKAEVGVGREVITVMASSYDRWIIEMADLFNRQESGYYVVLESCGTQGDRNDYARLASVEVAAGKGPDIFCGDVLGDYAWEIAQKGGFAELTPYLENSDMEEKDFFSCAFGRWRNGEGIYSVSPLIVVYSYYMDANVLGGNMEPGIETLTDSLLSWHGNAVYRQGMDSTGVLETFLKGSEDIWGVVDWEAGTCDFSGTLFARILEAAKRYGDNSVRNYPGLTELDYYQVYLYKDRTLREAEGLAAVETLFDDGCHPEVNGLHTTTLAINVNSAHKVGAWEFISFLLGDEAQEAGADLMCYPARKSVFDSWIKKEQSEGAMAVNIANNPEYYEREGYHYLTDERIAELREELEGARFLPYKTEPILDIIYEEAQGYFAGQRSIDEIIANIENRVQLYLNEQH